jgi:1,4-dihydroxy-2-naphthoate octaprenyltransferase
MRYLAQIILGLAYITLIGYIVYLFQNPWWALMLLFTPAILDTIKDNDNNPDVG